jgi:peptide/nickel transport system ATP-binding protein
VTVLLAESHCEVDAGLSLARPLMIVDNLRVAFPAAHNKVEAVRGVSFMIAAGEILALVGQSGSGKSVTARALVGLAGSQAQVDANAMTIVDHGGRDTDLLRLAPSAWRDVRGRLIGFVLQDALVSLDPLRTIGREVAEPILTHRLSPRSAVASEVESLLVRAGIPDPDVRAAQYPHELSGGLRQRALIASALAGRPQLLIADEPTTALDVTVQQQVLSVFGDLARAGHGVLLITHDLAVAAQVADRIAVMQDGRIVEIGPARSVLTKPREAYTRRLMAAVPGRTRDRGLVSAGAEPVRRPPQPGQGPPLLAVNDVSVGFRRPDGRRLDALAGVSVEVRQGETLGVVGESGSGKTTLGRVVLGLQRPDRGEVCFKGLPWSRLAEFTRRPLRPRLQTIVQDSLGSFDPRFTVERILEQPLRLRGDLDRAARGRRISELLEFVSLSPELLARRPISLSGGQRQRVSIAQALASEPDLLICDEPVSSLDVITQAQVLDLLLALQARLGLAMLFISHDLGVIQHVSHRIAVIEAGRIVESGTVDQVFDNPQHPYTQRLLSSVPRLPQQC